MVSSFLSYQIIAHTLSSLSLSLFFSLSFSLSQAGKLEDLHELQNEWNSQRLRVGASAEGVTENVTENDDSVTPISSDLQKTIDEFVNSIQSQFPRSV